MTSPLPRRLAVLSDPHGNLEALTSVLADMFREAGCRPVTVSYLSSRLEQYDVVVWAPDDFALPSEEVRTFLEEWLTAQPDRTLVYIGRDYQAACDYWEETRALAPPELQYEFLRRAARARSKTRRVVRPACTPTSDPLRGSC